MIPLDPVSPAEKAARLALARYLNEAAPPVPHPDHLAAVLTLLDDARDQIATLRRQIEAGAPTPHEAYSRGWERATCPTNFAIATSPSGEQTVVRCDDTGPQPCDGPVEVPSATLADVRRIFEVCRQVYNEVVAEVDQPLALLPLGDLQIDPPNPYYGKTLSGYVLEFYYGRPTKVHTPDGGYMCRWDNVISLPLRDKDRVAARLAGRLGLTLSRAIQSTSSGPIGPFYSVVGTATFPVPFPVNWIEPLR